MEEEGSASDYQAIILVCGDSGRLYPLTEDTPISLLPIANFPLLNLQVEALARVGFKSVLIAVAEESFAQVFGVDVSIGSSRHHYSDTTPVMFRVVGLVVFLFLCFHGDGFILYFCALKLWLARCPFIRSVDTAINRPFHPRLVLFPSQQARKQPIPYGKYDQCFNRIEIFSCCPEI